MPYARSEITNILLVWQIIMNHLTSICLKSYALYGLGTFNPQLAVSMY